VDHQDHVGLIRDGVAPGLWADLGSGGGAFTLALADLLGPGGRIVSVDRELAERMGKRFPQAALEVQVADFTRPLGLKDLDGIVMANSLHFVRRKEPVLAAVRGWLAPGGRLVLVEYDADRGNPWVPHPLSYRTWERVAGENGFAETHLLARRPSSHLNAMYSALSLRPR